MGTASLTPTSDRTFRAIQRRLAGALEEGARLDSTGPTLEVQRTITGDPPRLARAVVIEGATIERHAVSGPAEVGFAAFVDGIQASRVLHYDSTVPIVHGKVGAAVRLRQDRRLSTWKYATAGRIYAPLGCLSRVAAEFLQSETDVVDITPRRRDGEIDDDARHPLSLADVAVNAVQGHREALEQDLAEDWCARIPDSPLYVDGGISSSANLVASPFAIGVVKSHRTLYGDPAAVRTILSLAEGERSSAFTIGSSDPRRSAVTSWYLRINDSSGHDPLWGLVRVEVAPSSADSRSIGARADEVSRWILAEISPLALPDGRWHTMVYGIRDCEQFLRSVG